MLSAVAISPSERLNAPAIETEAMRDWQLISTVPFDRDLQLSVIEKGEIHTLIFPCRRTQAGWIDSKTGRPVLVDPTHWRVWSE